MTMDHTCDLDMLNKIIDRGLCQGVGTAGGQVCIEAAIALACDGVLTDTPSCVDSLVRDFCVALNDKRWSTPKARADGMRDLAFAQLGTAGAIDRKKFRAKLVELTIRRVLPVALRAVKLEAEAKRCEDEGTREAARGAEKAARSAASAAYAADAAAYAADAASAAYAADAAASAADAASAAYAADAAASAAAAASDAADASAAASDAADASARDRVLALSASCAAEAIRYAMPEVADATR
jgi:hypothetical protein